MDNHSNEPTLQVQGFTPYAQIPRWILRHQGKLSAASVNLYGVIMSYADNSTKAAFPGREKLAEDMGVKVRSISTYIKELEEFGALKVTRRRNKRTGNFYANHYVLVFEAPCAEYCTPPNAEDCPVTTPTVLPTPTGVTSEPHGSERSVAPSLEERGLSKASQSDPISPDFYASRDRHVLINNVQGLAQAKTNGAAYEELDPLLEHFDGNLSTAFNEDDGLGFLIWDRDWTPPKKCVSRFEAAKWLNTFLNAWKYEIDGITWRGEVYEQAA